MCVAFFSTKSEEEGRRILGLIKHSIPEARIKILRTLVGLAGSLKNFPSPDIALLVVADQAELSSVLSMNRSLQNSRVMLILPDRSEASLRLSLALSPLLICFRDSDFSEVVTLLARLTRQKQDKMGEIDPIRYWWSGELPCISSPHVIDDFEGDQLPDELPFFA
jgi:hypothetical protein